ncbi:MAG: hypothetical protein Q9165_000773 [Trypethelium subeluteriae]
MIELGLARISRLLKHVEFSWRAVHVAGTNGKGSICAYASTLLKASNISTGRFTSPHTIDRWDCIAINDKVVTESLFKDIEDRVKRRDEKENIQASEFELLTATAFEIFNHEKVEVGVVEVGMGGRLDATNVLQDPLVTVVSKIGLDHQEFLGNTIEAIAREKAGILKPGVPCVVDSTNGESVKAVVKTVAGDVGASPLRFIDLDLLENYKKKELSASHYLNDVQLVNYECAKQAVVLALAQLGKSLNSSAQDHALLRSSPLPGRLQRLSIEPLTGREQYILLDGAHNPQSAALLRERVDEDRLNWPHSPQSARLDSAGFSSQPVTWVLAARDGKDVSKMLSYLIKPGDTVVTTAFGPVDGMPWVKTMSPQVLLSTAAQNRLLDGQSNSRESVLEALQLATALANGGPLVVAGSLYLVGDIMRALRDVKNRTSPEA